MNFLDHFKRREDIILDVPRYLVLKSVAGSCLYCR